jgi:hypothetical protein
MYYLRLLDKHKAMKNLLVAITVLLVMVIGCNTTNEEVIADTETAYFRDYRGLDGCIWVIELTDGTRLEPINLGDFDIVPADGKKIDIAYTPVSYASICMVGEIVEITAIVER